MTFGVLQITAARQRRQLDQYECWDSDSVSDYGHDSEANYQRYRSNSLYPRLNPLRRESRSPSLRSPVKTSEENYDFRPAWEVNKRVMPSFYSVICFRQVILGLEEDIFVREDTTTVPFGVSQRTFSALSRVLGWGWSPLYPRITSGLWVEWGFLTASNFADVMTEDIYKYCEKIRNIYGCTYA
ncbi:uncharacterized protein TNCV_728141 [Trichonephila clavipes]|nr:uncharacterized protein TNCV_728141 [Trichonephila clavipes]